MSKVKFQTQLRLMLFLNSFHTRWNLCNLLQKNAAPPSFSPCTKPCCFDTFQPLTSEQVLILIKRAPDKTSDLDPVPTWLVQEFAPIFAPFFAHVFNVSLERGYLPASQKKAIVYPGL